MPGPYRGTLDPDEHVGGEPERLAGAAGVGGMVVDRGPGGGDPAVVERRLADELDLHRSVEALDRADQHVVGVVVGRGAGVRRDRVLALPGPIVSASWTSTHPPRVCHVVVITLVPGT